MNLNPQMKVLLLIPLPNGRLMALTQQAVNDACALADEIMPEASRVAPPAPPDDEPLLTAEQIGEKTNTPHTWFLEQARMDAIPHVKLGKYVRFRFSEVRDAFAQKVARP